MKNRLLISMFMVCRSNSVIANSTLGITQAVPQALSIENIFQWLFGLIVVVSAIIGIAWMVKKYGKFTVLEPGKLQVVASISLSAREKVVLLKADNTQILIGVAPGQLRTLHIFDEDQSSSDCMLRSEIPVSYGTGDRYSAKTVGESDNE